MNRFHAREEVSQGIVWNKDLEILHLWIADIRKARKIGAIPLHEHDLSCDESLIAVRAYRWFTRNNPEKKVRAIYIN